MKKSEANIEDLRNQTVSWGTHRPDDLIPKFMAVLKEYGKEAYDKYVSENPEVEDWKMLDDETKGWVVDELFDLLDGIAPEDCYFGAHPGDGADFGFWQVDESKKSEGLSIDDWDKYNMDHYAAKAAGWTWDDDSDCYRDKDGVKLGWDDFDSVMIDPIEYDGHTYGQVNVWGDGTVEFQDETGESTNWADFDVELVSKIYAVLGGKVGEAYEPRMTPPWGPEDMEYTQAELTGEDVLGDFFLQALQYLRKDLGYSYDLKKERHLLTKLTRLFDKGLDYKKAIDTILSDESFCARTGIRKPAAEAKKSEGVAFGATTVTLPIAWCDTYAMAQDIVNRLTWSFDKCDGDVKQDGDVFVACVMMEPKYLGDFRRMYKENYDSYCYMLKNKTDKFVNPDELGVLKGESKKSEANDDNWVAYYFCKDPQGLEWAVLPHTANQIGNVNCLSERGGMDTIGMEYVLSKCTPVENLKDSKIYKAAINGEDRRIVPLKKADAERIFKSKNGLEELNAVVGGMADESKKSEAVESSFIKDFRARMDTMDGELYDEKDILGWGWEWKSQNVGYPNGAKTYFEYFTMVDDGVPYTLVVKWNSFNDTIVGYDLWQEHPSESKKSEDFDMNKALFQAKQAITAWTKRQGHKTLEWLYTDGRKSPTSYPSGIWDFEWDTGNGMATAELKVSPYETRTNSWNGSMDFSLRVGTEDKPTFYTSVEDVLSALDSLISETEIKMESNKSEARPTKQEAQITELCELCRNDKNVAESVFKALTKDYNTSLDPVLAGQYLTATWKSKLEELGGCDGWYDGFKKLYAAMGSDFVCSVLQDLKLGSSGIGCGACITIVNDIYDKVVQRNESKKSEGIRKEKKWMLILPSKASVEEESAVLRDKGIPFHVTGTTIFIKPSDSYDEIIERLYGPLAELTDVDVVEAKKSESLTLKQKELKNMARYGEATDITTISDAEAKELKKKGVETIGISRGVYGMNGALLRDSEGNKYVITARSSNLFYFV